jgi:Family of unknown function (DUF5372)
MRFMQVIRDHHPLQGHRLQVLGQMHCRGRLELLLVLPDGSKSLIPAKWTDHAADEAEETGPGADGAGAQVLAAPGDLVEASVLVSALSMRTITVSQQAARQFPCKEDHRAACPTQSAPRAVAPAAEPADQPTPTAPTARNRHTAGPADRQDDHRTPDGGRR